MSARWLLLGTLLCGCAEPIFASLSIDAGRDAWSNIYESRIRMLHGQALTARVRPVAEPGRAYAPYDIVELRGGNAEVVELLPGLELDEHVFVGHAPGQARFEVLLDGEEVAELTVTVQAQRDEDD